MSTVTTDLAVEAYEHLDEILSAAQAARLDAQLIAEYERSAS